MQQLTQCHLLVLDFQLAYSRQPVGDVDVLLIAVDGCEMVDLAGVEYCYECEWVAEFVCSNSVRSLCNDQHIVFARQVSLLEVRAPIVVFNYRYFVVLDGKHHAGTHKHYDFRRVDEVTIFQWLLLRYFLNVDLIFQMN